MKKNKWMMLLLVLVFTLGTTLAACGGNGDDENGTDGSPPSDSADNGQDPVEGVEGGDLKIAISAEPVQLDPHGSNDVPSSNVAQNIYETLVYHDENLEIQPRLAKEFHAVDDYTWEFNLRDDVTFHDGEPFNAEAVKANLERVLDEDFGSPRAFLFTMISEINVVDEYTIQIVTEEPFAPLPAHFAHSGGAIISPAAIEAENNGETTIATNPVGTGPFKFVSWDSGNEIVLEKNEDYWGEPVKVDTVTFTVIEEDSTRLAMLERGDVHIADSVQPSDIARVEGSSNMELGQFESLSLAYIGFNTEKEPFNDVRVRQAISMAIDKNEIIEGVIDGVGIPAVGPIGPNVFGYNEDVSQLDYNVERAKELLAEAGYEDGFSTTIWTNDNRTRIDIAQVVQAQLAEIGVDMEIEVVEWGAYLEQTANGEHDMFILGWVTVTADADYGVYSLFHSEQHGDPGNRSFYTNEEVDRLLDEARRAPQEEREAMYHNIMEYLVEEAPMVYLYHSEYLIGLSPSIQGYWHHPNGIMMLHDVTIQ